MIRRPPRSTRTDTLLPDTTLFRSQPALCRLLDGLEAQEVSLDSLPDDLVARYLATDGPHAGKTLVEVIPAADLRDSAARERFVDAVQAVAPEVSGVPVTIVEAGRAVVAAFAQATLIALVGIVVLLLVVLRSVADSLLVLMPLFLAALLMVAIGVLCGLPFNFANVIVLPLLLGVGVDSGIHMVTRAREEAGGRHADPAAAEGGNSTPRAILQ